MNRKYLLIFGAAVVVLLVVLAVGGRAGSPWAKQKFTEAMEKRFDSAVEVDSLSVRLLPSFRADGAGLVVRHRGRTDTPPMIKIERFNAQAGWFDLLRMRVSEVRLDGLHVVIPRGEENGDAESDDGGDEGTSGGPGFITRIIADGARLEILPKDPQMEPMSFDMSELEVFDAGPSSPMRYVARLSNPKPPALIDAEGHFGPWNRERPRQSPLEGQYKLENVDLSHFKGISGTLSSVGSFEGVIERIAVKGTTDMPSFKVDSASQPVHLKTNYTAVVDGSSGDTYLEPVIAAFRDTVIVANGKIAGAPGEDGKSVILDVEVQRGRIEDILALAVSAEDAPLEGDIRFKAKLNLPPGESKVMQRLELEGRFDIDESTFSKVDIQDQVNELSQRAKGEPEQQSAGDVASDLRGGFQMGDGVMRLSDVTFQVPGASVFLEGDFGLESQELDFRGTLRMDAKPSDAATGVKGFFLKIVDPFFKQKRSEGAKIPITIGGTADDPQFGLALGGVPDSKK